MNDEQGQAGESFMDRMKESPRTVSALVIILIVAAAIYAFSGDQQGQPEGQLASGTEQNEEQSDVTEDSEAAAAEEAKEAEANEESDGNTTQKQGDTEEKAAGEVAGEDSESTHTQSASEEEQETPEARKTEQGYVEVAQAGDGFTHLARRASSKWLEENDVDYEVTAEHRVYIEDYIQDRIGSDMMEIGQEHLVSFDLIKEAVAAAGNLSETELQNLSQFSSTLS